MFPKRFALLPGFVCALLAGAPAWGEEVQLTPSLALKEEYNDNLFVAESDRQEVFLTTVSPGIDLLRRGERGEGTLSARLNALFYSERSERNALDQLYRGRVAYRLTPRLRSSAEGSYARESRPDRELEESGLTVADTTRRLRLAGGGEYALDERTAATLDYGFEQTGYQDRTDLQSVSHQLGVGLVRDLCPQTKGRVNLSGARHLFEESTVETVSATVGAVRQISEGWSAAVDAGGRLTRSEFDLPPPLEGVVKDESDDTGWVASALLSYRGEKGGGSVLFTRNVTVASGRGGATERTGVVLDLRRRFTWEFSGGLSAGVYLNRAQGGEFAPRKIDERTILVNPVLRYDFSRDLFLEASYQYSRVKDEADGSEAEQNRFFLRLTARFPLLG